jgi:hypothetical protein
MWVAGFREGAGHFVTPAWSVRQANQHKGQDFGRFPPSVRRSKADVAATASSMRVETLDGKSRGVAGVTVCVLPLRKNVHEVPDAPANRGPAQLTRE